VQQLVGMLGSHLCNVRINAFNICALQIGLDEAGTRLERSKDVFRDKVKALLEAFLRDIAVMQEEVDHGAPTSREKFATKTALAFVAKWKASLVAARAKVGGGILYAKPVVLVSQLCKSHPCMLPSAGL
jgi:hypothetical protein